MPKLILFIIFVMLSTGCSNDKQPKAVEVNGSLGTESLLTNLDIPWTITKHENHFYISQREGLIIDFDLTTNNVISNNITVKESVHHEGEGGLLGLVLAPDFNESKHAYAYHTYSLNTKLKNRVVLLQKEGDSWIEKKVLLEGIPGGRIHNGGRIKLGPDGKIYVTTGDAGRPELAQDLSSLAGKILRMEMDGTVPSDNPFENSYVYSYGHRNPQGLAWDEKANLYSTEHGQQAHDEINLIIPGLNYGWPQIQGDEFDPNMVSPLFQTGETTWAPSGISYDDGMLYIATLRDGRIRSFDLTTKKVAIFHENSGRMRDVLIEGNYLYTITNNRDGRGNPRVGDDRLLKITIN